MALITGDGLDDFRKKMVEARVLLPDWHVANDHWLQHVLHRLWPQFIALRDEISKDACKSTTEAAANYDEWHTKLTTLNPQAHEPEVEEEARRRSDLDKAPLERVAHRYLGRVMPLYTEVAILSAALCEAEINLAVAWGLSMIDKEDLFELLESNSAVEKWLHGPKMLLPDYKLPSGCAEAETLRRVFSERNRFVHPKSTVQKAGKKKLFGQSLKPNKLSDLLAWMGRYFSLPFDLADFLRTQPLINGSSFPVMIRRDAIEKAPQHKLIRPSARVETGHHMSDRV